MHTLRGEVGVGPLPRRTRLAVRWEYRSNVTEIEPHEALAANLYRIAFAKRIPLESVARAAGMYRLGSHMMDLVDTRLSRICSVCGVRV